MTNNLDATVFVFRHKEDGSIVATYLAHAKAYEQSPAYEHVATLDPRMWIQVHYGENAQLRTALDKLPHRMTPDEEDGEPDYYADGWNDCLDAMIAIRERSNERL